MPERSWWGRTVLVRCLWDASSGKYADRGESSPSDSKSLVAFVLSHIPRGIRSRYEEDGVKLEYCLKSEVVNTSYVFGRIQGASRIRSLFDASSSVGTYRPGMALIQVSQSASEHCVLGYPWDWKDHVDVAGHEMGHYVDHVFGNIHLWSSFMRVYAAERWKFDSYTRNSPSEFFADTFWICCAYQQVAREHLPKTYGWFSVFFETIASRDRRFLQESHSD